MLILANPRGGPRQEQQGQLLLTGDYTFDSETEEAGSMVFMTMFMSGRASVIGAN